MEACSCATQASEVDSVLRPEAGRKSAHSASIGSQWDRASVDSGAMSSVGSQLEGGAVANNLEV